MADRIDFEGLKEKFGSYEGALFHILSNPLDFPGIGRMSDEERKVKLLKLSPKQDNDLISICINTGLSQARVLSLAVQLFLHFLKKDEEEKPNTKNP